MFLDMFKYEGKFTKHTGKKNLKTYQNLYLMLRKKQNNRELPVHPENDYLGGNDLAKNIYKKKYFIKDLNNKLLEHSPEDLFTRVAAFIGAIETDPKKGEEWASKFYEYLYQGYFVPGGRVLAGALPGQADHRPPGGLGAGAQGYLQVDRGRLHRGSVGEAEPAVAQLLRPLRPRHRDRLR